MAVTITTNVSGVKTLGLLLTDVTTLFFTGAVDGQELLLELQQDTVGSHTVVSGNCPGIQQPNPAASSSSWQKLVYQGTTNTWISEPASQQQSQGQAAVTIAAAGAASKNAGLVLIGGGSATAVTLVAPVAGPPGIGDDGTEITFSCITAHAHTVTTPANKINGGADTVTFAAVGDSITLQAFNGVWYVAGSHGTATLSEV